VRMLSNGERDFRRHGGLTIAPSLLLRADQILQ